MHAITLPLLFPVVCVGLLVFSHGSDAFAGVSAGVPDHGGVTKRDARPIVPRRVLILPDSRAKVSEDKDLWHHHLKEVLKRQQERKEVGDDVPYALARTMRSRVQYEASYMIGARGKGNQANRGKCMERALQVFCGKQMEGIPRAVVEALLRY